MKKTNSKANAVEKFLGQSLSKNAKKVVLDEREGLIERVDKVYITKDGKQLLREQY